MKKSKEQENKDALIFILAIIFLAVVLISLGASFITYNVMRKEVKEIVANDELSDEEMKNISQTAALYTRRLMKEEGDDKPGVKANELAVVSEGASIDSTAIIGGPETVITPDDSKDSFGDDATKIDNPEGTKKPGKTVEKNEDGAVPGGTVVQQVANDVDEEGIIDRAIAKIKSAIEDKVDNDRYKDFVKSQDDKTDTQDKRNAEQDAKNDAQDKRNAEQDAKNDAQDKRNAEQDARNDAQDKRNQEQHEINAKQDEYNTYNTTIINKLSERVQIVNRSQAQSVKVDEGILYFYTE